MCRIVRGRYLVSTIFSNYEDKRKLRKPEIIFSNENESPGNPSNSLILKSKSQEELQERVK